MESIKSIDNTKFNTVYNVLSENLSDNSDISIITAYFSMYAYYSLQKYLNKISRMRIILNANVNLNNLSEELLDGYLMKSIFGTDYENEYKHLLIQSYVAREFAEWIDKNVEFKSFKVPNFAQTRLIHVKNYSDFSIDGSVDFTLSSLGVINSKRKDYNHFSIDQSYTNGLLDYFEDLWYENLTDIKDKSLNLLELMYKEYSPESLYQFTLQNIFSNDLDNMDYNVLLNNEKSFKNSIIWNTLYDFQKDAVMNIIMKLEKLNGCILSDSVGLGKTYTALGVIKYYELKNYRVLVLVPKKLHDNWSVYKLNDLRNILSNDSFRYDILNHSDLTRIKGYSGDIDLKTIDWGNYDLVVIDESHNFRNSNFKDGKITRYSRLMEDIIKNGRNTKVLMLSATPINNHMSDLKNQIDFITKEDDYAFRDYGIMNIASTLKKAQQLYNKWYELDDEYKNSQIFLDNLKPDYFKLLDLVTIARSRKHIEKYYNLKDIGTFPTRLSPINYRPDICDEEIITLKEIYQYLDKLNLMIYSPFSYIYEDKKEHYSKIINGENVKFNIEDRENSLKGLLKTNLLKRLESSIYSFKLTIKRLIEKINSTLILIKENANFKFKIEEDLFEEFDNDYEQFFIGETEINLDDMNLSDWKFNLNHDLVILNELMEKISLITVDEDQKLSFLKEIISSKIENPINENNNKIILFTEYMETADYLYENINDWLYEKYNLYSGLITGTIVKTNLNVSNDTNEILLNFSPISKSRNKIYPNSTSEIDLLICTDCISEGQNLQDADYLINYDIHWNPVRIIQRYGRIDRIGSKNDVIQLVNFWPNIELEYYIELKKRVEHKMMLVDTSTTGEANIISNENDKTLEYREKQLRKIHDEVVDIEDLTDTISITNLTFNDYKIESKKHKENLTKLPNGIHSIVNRDKLSDDNIEPGVIFLLKKNKKNIEQNILNPFYLIYITEKNQIKFNYKNPLKILDLYKQLCYGETEVLIDLVNEFNEETEKGKEMDKYVTLLKKSMEHILIDYYGDQNWSEINFNYFEVITFLIIK